MNRRELVKAAIGHRAAERPPYFIDICPEACEVFGARLGVKDWGAFLDNDVADVGAPWWDWHELGPDWAGIDVPKSRPAVMGRGSYEAMLDGIKAARDAQAEKYLLVRIYGSHFEKARLDLLLGFAGVGGVLEESCAFFEQRVYFLEQDRLVLDYDLEKRPSDLQNAAPCACFDGRASLLAGEQAHFPEACPGVKGVDDGAIAEDAETALEYKKHRFARFSCPDQGRPALNFPDHAMAGKQVKPGLGYAIQERKSAQRAAQG